LSLAATTYGAKRSCVAVATTVSEDDTRPLRQIDADTPKRPSSFGAD
jgi:hypothetical protein